jgi:hypothetical protein
MEIRMRSLMSVLALAGLLSLAPFGDAGAQARFSVAGGIAAPMSDLGDAADVGYNVTAGLNFDLGGLPIDARLEGSLSSFGLQDFPEDVRILNATANAVVNLGQQRESPYLIGGLGIYNSKFGNAGSESAAGVNLGGGLRFVIGELNTFFEARYHAMFGEAGVSANLQYVPIVVGVVF